MSDQEKNNLPAGRQGSLSTLILGAIIGVAITYLFTNKKGKIIKDHLLVEGKKMLEDLAEIASEVEENVGEKLKEEIKEVEQVAQDVPQHIEQIQKKGRRFFFRRAPSNPES